MSVAPDATRKGHIDTLIVALKDAGVWTKLDVLRVHAAHDAQAARLNWVSASYDATAVNSPTFTTDRGYTGDGATSYLDSGFNPATASGKYAQNDAHQAVWIGTNVASTTQFDVGNTTSKINSKFDGTRLQFFPQRNASITPTVGAIPSTGWLCWRRNNSSTAEYSKDGAAPVSGSLTSSAMTSVAFYELATSSAGPTAGQFSTRRLQATHWGSALTDGEIAATYNAIAAFMTAVGAA